MARTRFILGNPINDLFRRAGAEAVYHKLVVPYFSHAKSKAALAGVAALNAGHIGGGVFFSYLSREMTNHLAERRLEPFIHDLGYFGAGIFTVTAMFGARSFLSAHMRLGWKTQAKESATQSWLSAANRPGLVANDSELKPEQRIAADIDSLVDKSYTLAEGFTSSTSNALAYAAILFMLSPTLLAGTLGFTALTTLGTNYLARAIKPLTNAVTAAQADYRSAIDEAKKTGHHLALYRGEAAERQKLSNLLLANNVVAKAMITAQAKLDTAYNTAGSVALLYPFIFTLGNYFRADSKLSMGDVTQQLTAFYNLHNSLSWWSHNQGNMAEWKACAERLTSFVQKVDLDTRQAGKLPSVNPQGLTSLSVENLPLYNPVGTLLSDNISFTMKPGEQMILTGPSGCGKSSLVNIIAGLHRHQHGQIAFSGTSDQAGEVMFVPQSPYIPDLPMRTVLAFPQTAGDFSVDAMRQALEKVGLGHKTYLLDDETVLGSKFGLSGGEGQRLSFARLILHKPLIVGLDEATSAFPDRDGVALYKLLFRELPNSMIISVAHRRDLIPLHKLEGRFSANGQFQVIQRAAVLTPQDDASPLVVDAEPTLPMMRSPQSGMPMRHLGPHLSKA